MPAIYSFEAKSIQAYILDSNKLRDIVAASEQIEDITSGLLDKVLKTLNLQNIQFSRKAGGAFIAILENLKQAQNLRDLWTYTIRHQLPGLEFVQGLQEYNTETDILTAEKSVSKQKLADRNRLYPILPIAGPLIARSPRTGEPAITQRPNPKKDGGTELLDKRTYLKRRFLEIAKSNKTGLALENKLKLESKASALDESKFIWPKTLEAEENQEDEQEFPLLGENRYIGVIHADGNGLGELLMQVREDIKEYPQHYAEVFRTLSETIDKATIAAAKQATQEELVPHAELRNKLKIMPARPLVLGGDDLTIIVRGDLAIPFTTKFLELFEEQTEELFTKIKTNYKKNHNIDLNLPKGLTACAGIAFIKVSQPFYMAYHLAESLCKTAKTCSKAKDARSKDKNEKRVPSSIAFHRITTSVIDDYNSICEQELTTPENWLLTMQAYAVGKIQPACHFPRLKDLDKLRKLLTNEQVSYGAIRELLNLLHLNPISAERAYKRWSENMQKWNGFKEFKSVLNDLVGKADEQLPILTSAENQQQRTPLADALAWNGIARGSNV